MSVKEEAVAIATLELNSDDLKDIKSGQIATSSVNMPLMKWVHIAVSRNSGTVKLFQDGINVGNGFSDTTNLTETQLNIGGKLICPCGDQKKQSLVFLEKLSKSPSTMYKYAYDMLVMENYVESENAFKVFIGEHPKDPLASNAYYWLGETYYVQKKFQLAAISFARGYQSFPKGNKALDQLFKLSLTFINMGKYEDACASFSKLEVEFPKAPKRISNRAKEYKKRAKC